MSEQRKKPGKAPGGSLATGGTTSAAASGQTTPVSASKPVTDIYRPLAAAIQRPLARLLPASSTPLPTTVADIFELDPSTFTSRLKNKNILLDTPFALAGQPSKLIQGKKLHKGHPEIRGKVREEAEYVEAERKADGVEGVRRVKRKLRETGCVMDAGMSVPYSSLVPLNHMHLAYLTHLLSLPPLPSASSSSTSLPQGISAEGIQSRLSKADLTGLSISVLSARNPSLHGITGIVIEETSSTFRLVPPDSRVRVIPKSGTLFEVLIPAYAPPGFEASGELYEAEGGERPGPVDWEKHLEVCPRIRVLLLGTAFGFRSGDRAGRKFRPAQGRGGGSGWGEQWVQGEWAGVLEGVERDIKARSGGVEKGDKWQKKGKRHRNKGRTKDPPAWGRLEVT
ncbi:uncharacterized protein MKK02DRAFT_44700 [Dioszegia hungarica]|uniref:Uncharacterized protein n=1 Tax=Dioszegia hungarica TaxID=4972 RepID=A0AA38H7T3_9TREE|nr:uncharacterized protein MKK02DRAFT_44700 [Dioszegia hungarica]KAI9636002.1 hypothetical protein MKK02DRAFT_44700 [Dioszegia hungarica]